MAGNPLNRGDASETDLSVTCLADADDLTYGFEGRRAVHP